MFANWNSLHGATLKSWNYAGLWINLWTICYSYWCIFLAQINSVARLALTSLESGFHLYIKMAILGQNQDPAAQLSCLQHSSSGTAPANLASTVSLGSKFHTLNMHFVKYLQLREVVFKYQSAGSLIPLSFSDPFVTLWSLCHSPVAQLSLHRVSLTFASPLLTQNSHCILAECISCNCKAASLKHCNINRKALLKFRTFSGKSGREVLERAVQQEGIYSQLLSFEGCNICSAIKDFEWFEDDVKRCWKCSIIKTFFRPH